MNPLHDLSLRGRLLVSFIAVMLLADLGGALALFSLGRVHADARSLATESLPKVQEAAALQSAVHRMRIAQFQAMLADEEADRKAAEAEVAKTAADANARVHRLMDAGADADLQAVLQRVNTRWGEYQQGNQRAMALTGEFGLKAMGGAYRSTFEGLQSEIEALTALETRRADAMAAGADTAHRTAQALVPGVLLLSNLLGLGVALLVSRRIGGPLIAATRSARAVAQGDLAAALPPAGRDEVGLLIGALREMQQGLARLVTQVRQGVDQMSQASREIASGSMDLSSRTEQQAKDLLEAAQAISLLTETLQRNAGSAHTASQNARAAAGSARHSGEVTQRMIETMDRIRQSSDRIAEIVGVIDGIAFQTNILALNAAVEAARAGEQGRGFAVVAAEVRSLAQRSAQSAREIKDLIVASTEVVGQGAGLVREAGQVLAEAVTQVDTVAAQVQDIAGATDAQAADLARIDAAVARINDLTHQNSALVEQSAAAAAQLKDQGVDLGQAVSVFKLEPAAL